MVQMLLSRGAEVNTRLGGSTPIFLASQEGNLTCVVTLLQHGADQFREQSVGGALPIHAAAQKNYTALVEALIDHGCNIDQVTALNNTRFVSIANCSVFVVVCSCLE